MACNPAPATSRNSIRGRKPPSVSWVLGARSWMLAAQSWVLAASPWVRRTGSASFLCWAFGQRGGSGGEEQVLSCSPALLPPPRTRSSGGAGKPGSPGGKLRQGARAGASAASRLLVGLQVGEWGSTRSISSPVGWAAPVGPPAEGTQAGLQGWGGALRETGALKALAGAELHSH